ncbi:hypothetical protein DRW48_12025 [Paracoccus suum]|uniref:Biopolymer transporter ExbB n=1 Tax=Paracoccus suum TaxID=2259340 RepID=A0A344PPE6_9RHOB|nr:hypothetical protein DRW48_12025 [Paracoccus suum]
MRRADAASAAHFSQPVRQILLMLIVLGLVGVGGTLAYRRIWPIFESNPWLNGTIAAVFALGVLTCFWQVVQLVASVSWIERFASRRVTALKNRVAPRTEGDGDAPPSLLAPLATLLGSTGPTAGLISTTAARSIQESVAARINEARDVTRYLSQLLIFLGLLGTFYGLATTIPGVVETIRALAPREGETGVQMFGELMTGLESQLGGMATAFSSSLLGLAGSLVVGLLDLFAGHGQNRFYRELEEWMTGFTRVGLAGPDDDGASLDHAAMAHFLDQLAQQTVALSEFYAQRDALHEQDQIAADERARGMARSVERLAEHVLSDGETAIERAAHLAHTLGRIADGQERLLAATTAAGQRPEGDPAARVGLRAVEGALHRLADGQERLILLTEAAAESRARSEDNPEARLHLRSIDSALQRMAEEQSANMADMLVDLRADLAVLTRTVRALGEPLPPSDHGA